MPAGPAALNVDGLATEGRAEHAGAGLKPLPGDHEESRLLLDRHHPLTRIPVTISMPD